MEKFFLLFINCKKVLGYVIVCGYQEFVRVMCCLFILIMVGGKVRYFVSWKLLEIGVRGKLEKIGFWEGVYGCQVVIIGFKVCDYWCLFWFLN